MVHVVDLSCRAALCSDAGCRRPGRTGTSVPCACPCVQLTVRRHSYMQHSYMHAYMFRIRDSIPWVPHSRTSIPIPHYSVSDSPLNAIPCVRRLFSLSGFCNLTIVQGRAEVTLHQLSPQASAGVHVHAIVDVIRSVLTQKRITSISLWVVITSERLTELCDCDL